MRTPGLLGIAARLLQVQRAGAGSPPGVLSDGSSLLHGPRNCTGVGKGGSNAQVCSGPEINLV
jgi:hypothetical protein